MKNGSCLIGKAVGIVAVAGCAFTAFAVPSVSNVTMKPASAGSSRLEVSYDLADEPAIVTFDIHTNGVSIGLANVTYASGDVNHIVSPGLQRKFIWRPDRSWPGHIIKDGSVTAVVTAWATNAPPNIMVVDLNGNGDISFYEDIAQLPDGGLENDKYRTTSMVFRKIPARGVNWRMGVPKTEIGSGDVDTTHWVGFSEDYYMGIYEVTQKQYHLMTGQSPSKFKGDMLPVEKVAWTDHIRGYKYWPESGHNVDDWSFLGKLRACVANRIAFDLPTEAQWEYACRAGTGTSLNSGTSVSSTGTEEDANLDELGWYGAEGAGNSHNTTHRVGLKKENGWGLYDMHGNVFEWCLDFYGDYDKSVTLDPPGVEADSQQRRILRGGSWYDRASSARSGYRTGSAQNKNSDNRGFRVACPAVVAVGN